MLKIRRPLGRLIFNMGIAIPGKTVFLIETAPCPLTISLCLCVYKNGAKDECPNGLVDDEKLIKFHKIEWDQLKPDVLSNYRQNTDNLLGDIELPDDIADCSGVDCDNHGHILYSLLEWSVWVHYALPVKRWHCWYSRATRNAPFLLCPAGMITLLNH